MMKKKKLKIALCILLCIVACFAIYRFFLRKSIPEGTAEEKVMAILQQNDCFVCHSKNAELPFYASFPIIGNKIKEHVTHGTNFIDLKEKLADLNNVDEVTLSMLDHAITYDRMPLTAYKLIHWGTGFNAKEKSVLAAWIHEKRGSDEPISAIPDSIPYDVAKARLGEKMYNDKRISLDGTISCATCHVLEKGGADKTTTRTSEGINGQFGGINAPTVYNACFNVRQFWNGRAADLKEQAAGPPANPVEMGDQTWDQIVARLSQDAELVAEFQALFPSEGLTESTVTEAIAEFEKTLVTPNSRFDQFLKGKKDALTAEEQAGYALFKENACATCHVGVNMGGKTFERLSIFGDYYADRDKQIVYNADDDGLKGFTQNDADLHKFKVPSLRNIALTAPYFHDGQYNTLEEAVAAMARYELGTEMATEDVQSIVAFLKTLTGKNQHLK
ncbi:MAG: heme-binding domain-containing protein [Bacteroidales bacterium]|nr:heme-binding domain-containing protein [Candidatus Physcousia equi]